MPEGKENIAGGISLRKRVRGGEECHLIFSNIDTKERRRRRDDQYTSSTSTPRSAIVAMEDNLDGTGTSTFFGSWGGLNGGVRGDKDKITYY